MALLAKGCSGLRARGRRRRGDPGRRGPGRARREAEDRWSMCRCSTASPAPSRWPRPGRQKPPRPRPARSPAGAGRQHRPVACAREAAELSFPVSGWPRAEGDHRCRKFHRNFRIALCLLMTKLNVGIASDWSPMRLVSFRHAGAAKFGAVVEGGIVDLSARTARAGRACARPSRPRRWPSWPRRPRARTPISSSTMSSCCRSIPNPDKILCIGLNYASHVGEVGRAAAHRAQRLLAPAQHAGAARRQHRAARGLDQLRLRGRARGRDRRALPARAARQRAVGGRGLHLLPRCQRARLPEALGDGRQELPGDRAARALDGHDRRHCPIRRRSSSRRG